MFILQFIQSPISFCRGVFLYTTAFLQILREINAKIMNKLLTRNTRFDIIVFILW